MRPDERVLPKLVGWRISIVAAREQLTSEDTMYQKKCGHLLGMISLFMVPL